ncbi:hypothetical protein G7054_g10673 [Neopestalotiopsis clavispora]|nr:hypothetical protein G7054_g10673 [Neopestalotiopsis clavispora]
MDARIDPQNPLRDLLIDDLKDYTEACDRYMERIRRLDHVGDDDYLTPNKSSFPFNGDTRIVGLLMRHSPEVLFGARDIFGCNALTASILIADQKDVEQLLSTMDNATFLSLTTDAGDRGFTILHIAAMRNLKCVFKKIRALNRQGLSTPIDLPDTHGAAPLLYAAINGSRTTIKTLLELGANSQAMDRHNRTALHHASWKEGEDNARQLVYQCPALCAGQYIAGDTSAATECDHLEISKIFLQQPYRGLLEADDGGKKWRRLLHRASKSSPIQLIELLRHSRVVSRINQRDEFGQTAICMAAQGGNLGAVIVLLNRDADVSIADRTRQTPKNYARKRGDLDMVSVLDGFAAPDASQ